MAPDIAALEAPMKMRMALGALPALPDDALAAFEAWLAAAATASGSGRAAQYAFATDAWFDTVTWRASYEASGLAGGIAAQLEDVAPPVELARLEVAVETVRPPRVTHWIDARAGAFERGWRMPAELPLARALALADANPKVVALAEFGEANGLGPVESVGRAVGLGGNGFTEVVVRLPGAGEAALDVGLEAYRALKAPRLPRPLIDAMRTALRGPLSLSVWLTERALSRVALVSANPANAELLQLCQALGADELEPLAAVEGALGVEVPCACECAVGSAGPTVQADYELAGR